MHLKHILSISFLAVMFKMMSAQAADIKSIGVPYVQNYTKAVYQSGNQNWSVSKDERGVLYFGNAEGLLSFDGRYWQLYKMPNRLIVRAVAADGKGKVYVGGFGELGYWAYDNHGIFRYYSLVNLIPAKDKPNDEIWKIYTDGGRIIFQSFAAIYSYEHGKMQVIRAGSPFLFLLKAGNRFFAEVIGKGLFELKGTSLSFIRGSELLGNSGVLSILPDNTGFIIGTAKNGLFLYDGTSIRPWKTQADSFLRTYQLNNGTVVLDKYFAFGTILNGIIIIDRQGNVVQRINKESGLQNNTVLSLFTDNGQNIWAGLDNGVDRIEANSSLYYYFDKTGRFGTVYSSIIYKNNIYLGTNQGLFYSAINPGQQSLFQSFDFRLIENSQGQVWDLSLLDGQLFCGHNNGTYKVTGNSITRISDVNGGWVIKKLYLHPDLLIQGTYNGLVIYKKDKAGSWIFSHKVAGFNQPSRYVEQDSKGQIWVGHAYKGIFKLTLNEDFSRVKSVKYYDEHYGLPGSYNINIFSLEGRIVFSSDAGFYVYDEINDRFYPYTSLNRKLGSFASSNKIIPATPRKYWFINHGKVALADIGNPGKFSMDSVRFSMLENRMVQYYENISRINNSLYLISVDDGFVIFNASDTGEQKLQLPAVLIRKIENTTGRNTLISENGAGDRLRNIRFAENNIRIQYALPYYRQSTVKYQYFLEGYSQQWSEWSSQSQKEFTNLGRGNYVFKVRAKVNDSILSGISTVAFTILPPWYATVWAWLAYLVLIVVLLLVFRRVYYAKLHQHQQEIQRKLIIEQEEYLKREAILNEQKIMHLKNEQLQADLASKNREIANSAMNIASKNELLHKIKNELHNIKAESKGKLSDNELRKIHKVIDEGLNDKRDWNLFEKSFNEAHENFFKKLKAGHPDLVPNDLKLCAYLRMNMSSKEIASLLNITVRGVEIRRYRLRKKLNLEHDKNLVEFLIEL
ncbi:transcriptional regulator [Pedobacter sp. BS3]|uniref:ligand-binding sensor domain-containing protein n=1 Tax=Pedobacter sp. BS3 TaxID=2567937 RepID=UPI0011ED563C|nr:triple tyrosine motif-containing protein [Pedobacter sp. BS3]TZF83156.1 transcriptional regulator [Pedobacter sp. BS3]